MDDTDWWAPQIPQMKDYGRIMEGLWMQIIYYVINSELNNVEGPMWPLKTSKNMCPLTSTLACNGSHFNVYLFIFKLFKSKLCKCSTVSGLQV